MKPWIHAQASARRYGGKAEDYLDIHDFLDSSKAAIPDNRHRALTHNSWFLFVLEKVFGTVRTNSEGKEYSVRGVGEDHIKEDYGGFIPSATDFLQLMEFADWMNNGRGEPPPSYKKLLAKERISKHTIIQFD
jgi:hypothetical protein